MRVKTFNAGLFFMTKTLKQKKAHEVGKTKFNFTKNKKKIASQLSAM